MKEACLTPGGQSSNADLARHVSFDVFTATILPYNLTPQKNSMTLKRKNSLASEQATKRSRPPVIEIGTTTPLLKLPVALIQEIAKYLGPADLRSSRRICKILNTSVLPLVCDAFFADKSILISDRTAMDILHHISRTRHLAEYVRNVRFSKLEIVSLESLQHNWLPEEQFWLTQLNPRTHRFYSSWQELARLNHSDLKREQDDFFERDLSNVLISILNNFIRLETKPTISFHDYDTYAHEQCRGHIAIEKQLDEWSTQCAKDDRYHQAVYKAMATTGYSQSELEIGKLSWELPVRLFSSFIPRLHVHSLRKLGLYLKSNPDCYLDDLVSCPLRREDIRNFALVLRNASNVEELQFYQHTIHTRGHLHYIMIDPHVARIINSDLFHAFTTKTYLDGIPIEMQEDGMLLPKLKRAQLEYFDIDFDLLLQFCRERKDTLESIEIIGIQDGTERDENDVKKQLYEALGSSPRSGCTVSLGECYDGEDFWL